MIDENISITIEEKKDKDISDYYGKEISGEKFCKLFPNLSEKLVKLTNEKENHNGFQFKTGLNEDTIPFNPTDECKKGGIYFTDINNISNWLYYNGDVMKYCRPVTLPSDCRVYVERGKIKADKIILDDRVEIKDLPHWLDEDFCLKALERNYEYSYNHVKNFSEKIQLYMINNEIYNIDIYEILMKKVCISEKVQLDIVKINGKFIKKLIDKKIDVSEDVQLAAIKQKYKVIKYIKNPSEFVKLVAIKQNYKAIKYIKNPSEDMQLAAIEQTYKAIIFINNPSEKARNYQRDNYYSL